jgi:hypothetical protein
MRGSTWRISGVLLGSVLFLLGMLALGGGSASAKQDKPGKANGNKQADAAAMITVTARLVAVTTNGETAYKLQDAAGKTLYYPEVGPKWFYKSDTYPLKKYAGQQVTVTGKVEPAKNKANGNGKGNNGNGNGNKAQAAPQDAPSLEVYTINGEKIRDNGKPPWAGGPKNVQGHPGCNGVGNKHCK